MPCGIRFTPDGKTAVVALGRADRIAVIDVASRTVKATIPVGKRVWHLALNADGSRAFTANGLSNDVSVVDLAAGQVIATVPAGVAPWGAVLGD
jgi:YVTN family beta-propeller protein